MRVPREGQFTLQHDGPFLPADDKVGLAPAGAVRVDEVEPLAVNGVLQRLGKGPLEANARPLRALSRALAGDEDWAKARGGEGHFASDLSAHGKYQKERKRAERNAEK